MNLKQNELEQIQIILMEWYSSFLQEYNSPMPSDTFASKKEILSKILMQQMLDKGLSLDEEPTEYGQLIDNLIGKLEFEHD